MNVLGIFVCLIVVMAFSILALLYKPMDKLTTNVIEIVDMIHRKITYDRRMKQRHIIIKQKFNNELVKKYAKDY